MNSKVKDTNSCCSSARKQKDGNDCSASGSKTQLSNNKQIKQKCLDIDFMYLDLNSCTRCQGTNTSLSEAIEEVSHVLEATGIRVKVNRIHVKTEKQAEELGFTVSPTIKVNGHDIQMNYRESLCESCGTLCDCKEGVSCREWEYQGKWYTEPPAGLIIEAILKSVYGGIEEMPNATHDNKKVPVNLKRFFDNSHQSIT